MKQTWRVLVDESHGSLKDAYITQQSLIDKTDISQHILSCSIFLYGQIAKNISNRSTDSFISTGIIV